MRNTFQNNLDHARAAYLFAIRCLPDPAQLESGPIHTNGFVFRKRSQIESMLIELGWAFFCRYESCLEVHLKRAGVHLSKEVSLVAWLEQNNVTIPVDLRPGLEIYRQIRNKLHHEDGASFSGAPDQEIHLLPQHMENFYQLFKWCGSRIECAG
ncbi:MAG: hypothetical protein AB1696_08740 [Planctomycetota bacterium]